MPGRVRACATAMMFCLCAYSQVIEFESGGLKYQTLTRRGVTLMFAHMPAHVRDFSIVQVAVSNGSAAPYTVPERPKNSATRPSGLILAEQCIGITSRAGSK